MNQCELNRQVARITGESIQTIKRLGFLLDDPESEQDSHQEEFDIQVIDWDQLDLQRESENQITSDRLSLLT